jgi:cytochrome c6
VKKILYFSAALLLSGAFIATGSIAADKAGTTKAASGSTLFNQNCSPCHPNGGNTVNPQKTLHRKDREANGVRTAADIMKLMRNPGPGMTKFDRQTIPDDQAKAIANYVIKTYK